MNVDLDADPLPPPVRTYIVETEVPAFTVTEEIVVGAPVPENVVVRDIPDYDYHYAVINERRVLIEPETRRVVTFVDY